MRYLTAGESHGKALVAILEGMPAGLKLDVRKINYELKRRQSGFGRGARMQIEKDTVQIVSGMRKGVSLGSPIALLIENKDCSIESKPSVLSPRPGHADLSGILKYGFKDARDVLERASARETASRVAVGAVCKLFLDEFDIDISSKVLMIGGECSPQSMMKKIMGAKENKDTVGGIFEVLAEGVPAGLGSYVQADRRLDARLAKSIISIPGIKAIGFGLGFGYAYRFGSQSHDAIYYAKDKGYFRKTNNAGGIEGGVSNGEDIIIHASMKPICTLMKPLDSVSINSKKKSKASTERSDICVVEAAGVVGENACAFVLADAILEKFGSDNLIDIKKSFQQYVKRIK
ncbi:MAG: chorismate synthase [Candidatus Omnitrophica bacterium]|nr:chorismate synthase [Candidatus Omnitrophota bacterium]MBU1869457.1 chorismate synthase [Candidatus Omnitrophota bacterium]